MCHLRCHQCDGQVPHPLPRRWRAAPICTQGRRAPLPPHSCSGCPPQEQQQDFPAWEQEMGWPLLLDLSMPNHQLMLCRVCTSQAGSSTLASPTPWSCAVQCWFPRQSCRRSVVTSHLQGHNIHFSLSEHTFFVSVLWQHISWLNCTQQNRAVDLCVSLLSPSYSWENWS